MLTAVLSVNCLMSFLQTNISFKPTEQFFFNCAEYEAGSRVFVDKIKSLESTYSSIRRTRGDGNCFFRSFIFAYLENLVKTNDAAERNR